MCICPLSEFSPSRLGHFSNNVRSDEEYLFPIILLWWKIGSTKCPLASPILNHFASYAEHLIPELAEKYFLEELWEEVTPHDLCWLVADGDFFLVNIVGHEEIMDVDMTGTFAVAGPAIRINHYCAQVVLVHCRVLECVYISLEEVFGPHDLGKDVIYSNKFSLCQAVLVLSICFDRRGLYRSTAYQQSCACLAAHFWLYSKHAANPPLKDPRLVWFKCLTQLFCVSEVLDDTSQFLPIIHAGFFDAGHEECGSGIRAGSCHSVEEEEIQCESVVHLSFVVFKFPCSFVYFGKVVSCR